MGFDLEEFAQGILGSATFQNIFSNPIWSAILIVVVILLIIILNFYDYEDFWHDFVSAGIYIIFGTFTLVFLHYKILRENLEKTHQDQLTTKIVDQTIDVGAPEINVSLPAI